MTTSAVVLFSLGAIALLLATQSDALAALLPSAEMDQRPELGRPELGTDPTMDAWLNGTGLTDEDIALCVRIGAEQSVDPRALAALRRAENGGPQSVNPDYPRSGNPYRGGEWGIQTVYAPTPEAQCQSAAITLRHTMEKYEAAFGRSPVGPDGRLTADFLDKFSHGWTSPAPTYGGYAPTVASWMNVSHAGNLATFYGQIESA